MVKNREKRNIKKGGKKADAALCSQRVTSVMAKPEKPEVCRGNRPKMKEKKLG